MKIEWPILSLAEAGVTLLDCDHRTPPAAPEGYPYVTIPQIKDGRLDLSDVRRIAEEHFLDWTKKTRPMANDVVVVRRCSPGDSAHVPPGLEFALGQNLVLLRADGTRVAPVFLRWLVRSPSWWEQVQRFLNVGAVFDSLKCREIPNFRLPVPPIDQQLLIAEVLGSLDEKIALTRRMNQTLEDMAQTLFRSWFVNFDPVRAKAKGRRPEGMDGAMAALFPNRLVESELGNIPEGWANSSIYDVASAAYGTPFASRLFNSQGDGLPLIRIRDLSTHAPTTFTREVLDRQIVVDPGDIVVGMDGEFRVHHWRGPRSLMNQRVCKFVPAPGVSRVFVAQSLIGPMRFFENTKAGTTVIHLGKADIDTIKIVKPPMSIQQVFGNLAEPLLERVLLNEAEARTLADLRDTLLPRLLSGDIRVGEAEAKLAASV